MKRSKAYNAADAKIDRDALYPPLAATRLAKQTSTTKYDSTVEVAMCLGVDPRKADQMVRGTVNLPHGTGKTARVLVFATGERAEEARAAGADIVGSDELIAEVEGGRLDFDAVVSTPDLMGKVGRLGRVLGPRGLMPNPKTGTVTADVAKAVSDIKGAIHVPTGINHLRLAEHVEKTGTVVGLEGAEEFPVAGGRWHLNPERVQRPTNDRWIVVPAAVGAKVV